MVSSTTSAGSGPLASSWRKSSRSQINGNCLEAAWQKSSHSNSTNCTEAALRNDTVLVRDSKLGDGSPVLAFSPTDWQSFLQRIKA